MNFQAQFTITNRMPQTITRIERVRSVWHRFGISRLVTSSRHGSLHIELGDVDTWDGMG